MFSSSIGTANTHLSGRACRTVGMRTPEMALYKMESHTPTMFTTVDEPKTGSMCGGMPCQKCNRKLWTYTHTDTHTVS